MPIFDHPKRKKKVEVPRKKMRIIGLKVVRELESKLTVESDKHYEQEFVIYEKVLTHEQNMKVKIYSYHKPQPAFISEGKAHKAYEFGTKVAIIRGWNTGIITAVKIFSGNPHDSKTLEESLAQSERVRTKIGGTRPKTASTDRGFRRQTQVRITKIVITNYNKEITNKRLT